MVHFMERSVPVAAYTLVFELFTALLSYRKLRVIQTAPVCGNESVFYPLNAINQVPSMYLSLSIS